MSGKNKIGTYRYRILALLFVATTINYMDRSILGVIGPTLRDTVFDWDNKDYANINIAFKLAYAIGMLTMGGVIDRFGTRIGYTLSIAIWSIFGMLHAAVRPAFGLMGFIFARFGLGIGEAGNFPAAVKTAAEWFPKKDRAFATGIFNAGSNVGAILAPLIIPLIVVAETGANWQWAFLTTGVFSAIWVVLWLRTYKRPEEHPKLSKEELAYIQSDSVAETTKKLPWKKVFPLKQTWAFAIGKLTDAVWWFYLFWGAFFLADKFGLNIKDIALPLITIYVIADVGSIAGGWLSKFFVEKGWSINKARKVTLLICALCIIPVMFSTVIESGFKITNKTYEKMEEDGYSQREINLIKHLEGKEYHYAKNFDTELKAAFGLPKENVSKEQLAEYNAFKFDVYDHARMNKWYWMAVILIAIAAAGHQAWSANLFTLASDVLPKKATASVVGIGGMMGALAGMTADWGLGEVLDESGDAGYFWAFFIAGSMYLVILGIIHLMMPKLTPLGDDLKPIEQ